MDISSDSEDDCYGNVAKRLESLKEKYQEDNIDSTNLLNDSVDKQMKTNSVNKNCDSICHISDEELAEDIELEKLLAINSKRRVTRSSKRKSSADSSILETCINIASPRAVSKRGRRGGRNSSKNSTLSSDIEIIPSPRGRGRGRTRRNRPRRVTSNNIQTISIGNTMDYPDNSEKQTLFASNVNDVVIIDDNHDLLDENEELFLKIYWQSSEIFKFSLRKYQNLKTIFKHFSEKENVSQSQLLFTYNETILKPDDTPDSINYNIAKFIDGGIIKRPVTVWVNDSHKNECGGIKIKFQCQNVKKPFETSIQVNDKLATAMMKCAEHLELPITKLKFKFDGDNISEFIVMGRTEVLDVQMSLVDLAYPHEPCHELCKGFETSGSMTPKDLDLEGGECIDVKILN